MSHKKSKILIVFLLMASLLVLLFAVTSTFTATFAGASALPPEYNEGQVFRIKAEFESGVPYVSGTTATAAVNVTMAYTGTPNANTQFQYASVTRGKLYADILENEWNIFDTDGTELNGGVDQTRTFNTQGGAEANLTLYFRSKLVSTITGAGQQTTYYSDKEPLVVHIVPPTVIGDVNIVAEYKATAVDAFAPYDGSKWVSESIRFTATIAEGALLNYGFPDKTSGAVPQWYPLPVLAGATDKTRRTLTIGGAGNDLQNLFSRGYEGQIKFNYNGTEYAKVLPTIKYDPVTPEIQVDSNGYDNNGNPSPTAVEYTLSALPGTQNLSGVRYFYYTMANAPTSINDPGVFEISAVNGKYIHTVSTSTPYLHFLAVSGAGKYGTTVNLNTQIDTVVPEAKVVATDGGGTTVLDGGWASDSIKFVLSNLRDNKNAIYEYLPQGATAWQKMTMNNGAYSYTVGFPMDHTTSTLEGQVCKFRITSAAGRPSDPIITFHYSLAKSKFDFTMNTLTFAENVWINQPLDLIFYTDSKNYTFGYRVQNAEPVKPLVALSGVWAAGVGGKWEFRSQLQGSINGFAVSFVAINKANVESTSIPSPGNIKMDTKNAELEFRGSISGAAAGQTIQPGQWVNGKVNLEFISIGANISGFTIKKLIKNGTDAIPGAVLKTNVAGNYVDSLSETMVSWYRVITGAGKEMDVSYAVNIDNTAIALNAYQVKIGDDGVWLTEAEAKAELARAEASKNIYLKFLSNHSQTVAGITTNHFVYFYKLTSKKTGAGTFQKGDESGIYCFNLDTKNDQDEVAIEFYLQSTARNHAGVMSDTALSVQKLTVRYNKVGATLLVELKADASSWQFNAVTFGLTNTSDTGAVGMYRYQYSIDGKKTWKNIQNLNMVSGKGDFTFGAPGDGTTAVHLDGKMFFRALNSAGYSSGNPTEVPIKIDTTTPQTFRAIDFNNVKYTLEGQNLYYAGDYLTLKLPTAAGYAPTRFFWSTTTSTAPIGNQDPPATGSGWTKLDTAGIQMRSGMVYLYATNGNRSETKSFNLILDNTGAISLTLDYSAADGENVGNNFQFRWAETNKVVLRTTNSSTSVRYYYSILGTDIWSELTTDWMASGAQMDCIFDQDIDKDVIFKVVNKGGKEAVSSKSVRLRIDRTQVAFHIEASVNGQPYDATTYPNGGWSTYDIMFVIAQTSVNPSGVSYQYALGAIDNQIEPTVGWSPLADMRLTSLIIDRNNNGSLKGRLWIRAYKNATPTQTTSEGKQFKVDKLAPNFNLQADYTTANGTNKTILSGEWINTAVTGGISSVTISLRDRAITVEPITGRKWQNASEVTYLYKTAGMDDWAQVAGTFSYVYNKAERAVVQFRATSEAGMMVEKSFILNIDNLAPEFKNGNGNKFSIVNGENGALNTYYVDQTIRWIGESDESLLSATVNGLPLTNGGIISTYDTFLGTPGSPEYGKISIVVLDRAGNSATLKFILKPFPLTVENISLSAEDSMLLLNFNDAVQDAKTHALKDNARAQYFTNMISRLKERQNMLENEISTYKNYLKLTYEQTAFTLENNYKPLSENIEKYKSYPLWQQVSIREGTFAMTGGAEVSYQKAYNNMIERFNQLDILMEKVKQVERQVTLLPAVKAVLKTDYEDIMKAHAAYQSLSSDQKSSFQTVLVTKLVNLKAQCELLLLQDEKLGVSIFGDDLTAGAKLFARSIDSATEDYANTQRKILAGYAEGAPRALISLMKLSLTDFGSDASANPTGRITINLAIPEKYQEYLYFAVYTVDANGTVTRIEKVDVSANGKNVIFEANSLGTYALATAANVVEHGGGGKVYGTIFGIEIDAKMVIYILIAVGGLVVLLIVLIVITGLRRRAFLKRYDKRYKQGLSARGVEKVPKGNRARRRNPVDEGKYVSETKLIEPKTKKQKKSKYNIDLD